MFLDDRLQFGNLKLILDHAISLPTHFDRSATFITADIKSNFCPELPLKAANLVI